VRLALEELGPTFVKLGQMLATRVDLFEPEWIAEFGKLQDSAPAAPWDEVLRQLTEDLGAPPGEVFAAFSVEPLARLAEAESKELRAVHPVEVVRQFAQSLRRELDFNVECRNAERIAENFAGYRDQDVPGSSRAAARTRS